MGLKEQYQKLAKKNKLPSYDSLNNEFEITSIEETNFLLREIRRKITEKIELYVKVLDGLLHPESDLCGLLECRVFSDKDKSEMFALYKKLMFLDRLSIESAIDEDDKKSSEFINQVVKQWSDIKKNFLPIIKKMKESWLKDTDIKEELGYMG